VSFVSSAHTNDDMKKTKLAIFDVVWTLYLTITIEDEEAICHVYHNTHWRNWWGYGVEVILQPTRIGMVLGEGSHVPVGICAWRLGLQNSE